MTHFKHAMLLRLLVIGAACALAWPFLFGPAEAQTAQLEVQCGTIEGKKMCLIEESQLDALLAANRRASEALKKCRDLK